MKNILIKTVANDFRIECDSRKRGCAVFARVNSSINCTYEMYINYIYNIIAINKITHYSHFIYLYITVHINKKHNILHSLIYNYFILTASKANIIHENLLISM